MKEMISEGASVEEANSEAHEVFGGSGYDMSSIFIYSTPQEQKDKEQIDMKFKVLEDKAAFDNYVNSYVAMKSLEKSLAVPGHLASGIMKLAESRKLLHSILKIIAQTVGVEEEEEDAATYWYTPDKIAVVRRVHHYLDSLPAIGPIPGAPAVVAAFGGQHVGLTAGPRIGRLAAEIAAGQALNEALSAGDPGRFR